MNRLPKKGRFVKKPIPVYAEQWYPGDENDDVVEIRHSTLGLIGQIKTMEGDGYVKPGAYVMTGVKGEKYPCDEEVFNETYEVYDPEKHKE